MAKTVKQLLFDEKRKKVKVKKIESELQKEKGVLKRLQVSITAAKKTEAAQKKTKATKKKVKAKRK